VRGDVQAFPAGLGFVVGDWACPVAGLGASSAIKITADTVVFEGSNRRIMGTSFSKHRV